jgi:oligopeptide transport system substrate-binding protein
LPTFFENLLIANTFPVQRKNIKEFNDSFSQAGKLISNGAFKLTYRMHNDKVTINKNHYY